LLQLNNVESTTVKSKPNPLQLQSWKSVRNGLVCASQF